MLPKQAAKLDANEDPAAFASVATAFSKLSRERVEEIERCAKAEKVAPWQYGLEHGDFDLTDVDVIKTMMAPTASVQGYQIISPLGRGGMGVVYRARQLSLNRDVALKTILLSQLSNPTAVKRFENEAKILASLTHPNIVTAFDFGRHAGRLFLAMELIRGKDVQRLIEHLGSIPESLAWHIVRQAAAGLAQAAQAGVIHRDIKPANLLLVRPPDGFPLPAKVPLVKIADFGLSTLAAEQEGEASQRLTSASMNVGSPLYMAPEQIESKEASRASDIFSLGATAWHMLVGEPPLSGLRLTEIITKRLTEPTDAVSNRREGVSQASSDLIAEMMSIEPERRVSNYEELLRRIDGVLQDLPIEGDALPWLASQQMPASPPLSNVSSGDSLGETRAFDTSGSGPPRSKRAVWPLLLGVAIPLASIGLVVAWFNRPAPLTRTWDEFGSRITLFDGRTLAGWIPVSGGWAPAVDAEGSRVLRGTDGTITYDYSRLVKATSSRFFAIETSVDLGDAQMAMVEIGVLDNEPDSSAPTERLVIQLTPDDVRIGNRDTTNEFRPQQAFGRSEDKPMLLRIERQSDSWWLMLDGEKMGGIPQLYRDLPTRLSLSAVDGSVSFADISFVPEK